MYAAFFSPIGGLGPWVAALSSSASAESGWVTLGLVGTAFNTGSVADRISGCVVGNSARKSGAAAYPGLPDGGSERGGALEKRTKRNSRRMRSRKYFHFELIGPNLLSWRVTSSSSISLCFNELWVFRAFRESQVNQQVMKNSALSSIEPGPVPLRALQADENPAQSGNFFSSIRPRGKEPCQSRRWGRVMHATAPTTLP
jgi:hypothetical protein